MSDVKDPISPMTSLRETLAFISETRKGPSIEGWVLKHGLEWMGRRRPKGVRKQRDRMCFRNAALMVIQDPTLTYCEGMALSVIATVHAWVIDRDGNLIDPTWRNPEQCAYIGVPFKTKYLSERIAATMTWVSLLDDYEGRWPLINGTVELKDVIRPIGCEIE